MGDGRRICVTGGRTLSDRQLVEEALAAVGLTSSDILVEGEARGADQLCAEVARKMGAQVEPHPAKWQSYGNAAGHIRNTEMLRSGVDLLVAFPGGRGTAHCVGKAREMGIPVVSALEVTGRLAQATAGNDMDDKEGDKVPASPPDSLSEALIGDDMTGEVAADATDDPQISLF